MEYSLKYREWKTSQLLILYLFYVTALYLFLYHHPWLLENWSVHVAVKDHEWLFGSAWEQIYLSVQPRSMSVICEAKLQWACASRWLSDWVLSVWACGQPKQDNPYPHHDWPPPSHFILSLALELEQRERNGCKFSGQGFSGANQWKLLNDLISRDIYFP